MAASVGSALAVGSVLATGCVLAVGSVVMDAPLAGLSGSGGAAGFAAVGVGDGVVTVTVVGSDWGLVGAAVLTGEAVLFILW